jgi:uncharacterized SAM-binding protein YcdF (DUF218 family)
METDGRRSVDRSATHVDACELTGTECAYIKIGDEDESDVKSPSRKRIALSWIAGLLAFGCVLLLACYVFRAPLLTGVARAWMVDEPTTKADAIVILGGGLENRPFAAARLFHDGVASRILYMDVRHSPAEEMGITMSEGEVTHRILLSKGVPEKAMTMIGNGVTSTHDESKAVEAWMEKNGARSIIIPTDLFHTRRVRWVFTKELRRFKPEIHVVAVASRRYKADDWWQHEEGLIALETELVKYAYYRAKY